MARLNNQGIRTAKKNVSRWFVGTEARRFLPASGAAIPVSDEEELAIKAGSEAFIAKSYDRFQNRLLAYSVAGVAAVFLIYVAKGRFPALQHPIVDFGAYGIYAMMGLSMLHEAWRWERSVFDLRDAIAFSLLERQPTSPQLFQTDFRAEPNYRLLGAIAFGMSGAVIIWPMVDFAAGARNSASYFGPYFEGIFGILAGVVIGIVAFVTMLSVLRRRSAAPPEDGASR